MRKEQIITTNNNQMEEKGMKSRFIHLKKRFVPALSGALMGVMLMSTTCFAAGTGTSAVTQPLENLKTLIIAVIGAVGVIILAKNVSTEGEPAIKQLEAEQNEQVKKKGRKAEPETVTADSAVKKQEEFEAMKKKTRNMLLGLVAVIVAAAAGIAAYKAMH